MSSRLADDGGATAIEYALVVSLIAMTVLGVVTALGVGVLRLFALMPVGL